MRQQQQEHEEKTEGGQKQLPVLSRDASREMDALIAEKVVGLVPCQADVHLSESVSRYCHARPASPTMGGETACYSTDVAAAFEALDSVGGIVTITRKMGEWFVSIGSETRWAATLPLAICEALLASVLPTPSEGREA